MAYKKEQFSLLAGGINILPPPDKIARAHAIQNENWRADQLGRLRSRRGIVAVNFGDQVNLGGLTAVHTIAHLEGEEGMHLAAGRGLWAHNGGTLLSVQFDGNPIGWVNMHGFIWFMNKDKQLKRNIGGLVANWSVVAPTSALTLSAAAGASLTGDYKAYVTYSTAFEHESGPSPESNTVTLTAEGLEATGIPTSPDPQVTKRHVYVSGGTLGGTLRVKTIDDNTTTTIFLGFVEDDATDLGEELVFDRAAAPAARGCVGPDPFFNRAIVYDLADEANAYMWSPTNQPWYFPVNNRNRVGRGDTRILTVTHHKRVLLFYKPEGVFRLVGDPGTNADQVKTNADEGPVGDQAVASAGAIDYMHGHNGFYFVNADRADKISRALDPIFSGQHTTVGAFTYPPVSNDRSVRALSTVAFDGRFVHFSYPEEGSTSPNVTAVYNPATGQFVRDRINAAAAMGGGYRSMYFNVGANKLFAGGTDGFYYELNSGATDDGETIEVKYQTRFEDQNLPDNPKSYDDLVLKHNTNGDPVVVTLHFDDGDDSVPMATIQSTDLTRETIPIAAGSVGKRARNVSLELVGSIASDLSCNIDEATLHYRVDVREGKRFDSAVLNLGVRAIKELDKMELVIEAPSPVTWKVKSDRPGAVLTQRDTGTIPASSGEDTEPVNLAAALEGERYQFTLESDEPFRLQSFSVRIRLLGEYLDADASDTYESAEFSVAAAA